MKKKEKLKVCKTSFANSISYASCNEDTNSEFMALDIKKSDTVLCVTASGGRVINLLLKKPKKIIAIDLNPIQNYLLELKLAGIKHLTYDEYLKFLGVRKCWNRKELYNRLRKSLSKEAMVFWDERRSRIVSIIVNGLIYRGNFELFVRSFSLIMRMIRFRKVKKLFEITSIVEQRDFFNRKWNTKIWRFTADMLFRKTLSKNVLRDPGFYYYVPGNIKLHEYMRTNMEYSLNNHLAKDNFFTALFLRGKYIEDTAMPLYLKEENFNYLKENMSSFEIEYVIKPIEQYLKSIPEGSINKFSLSDVSGYLDQKSFDSLINAVHSAGSIKSVFCLRHFVVKRDIPSSLKSKFNFNTDLEHELKKSDKTFLYSFNVGQKVS